MQGLQDTSNRTFREIVGNGVQLSVPRFQRDYTWKDHHWADLWEDITSAQAQGEHHYLGFIVLQRNGDNDFAIIDGQQRITTMSLLVIAAIRVILEDTADEKAKIRAETLRRSYIGRQNPVTLLTSNKLRLNRNNERFYARFLAEGTDPPKRGLRASERLLGKATDFFSGQLRQLANGEEVARLIEFASGHLFFTSIQVTSELNAYRVFETLNARGVKLSAADLLKNFLFATVDNSNEGSHHAELEELETRWAEILEALGRESVQELLRAYWNSRYGKVRSPNLYRAVRNLVKGRGDVFNLLRDLAAAAPIYVALRDPNDEMWETHLAIKDSLVSLKVLRVRQHIPLLLAGFQSLNDRSFERLCRDVLSFSFRYNTVGGLSSGDQETLYSEVSLNIRKTKSYQPELLSKLYPSDDEFRARLKNWTVSSTSQGKTLARYVLVELERHYAGKQIIAGDRRLTLEHILPQSSGKGWPNADDPIYERAVWRLGNLALLEEKHNRSVGQHPVEEKIKVYLKSEFKLTQEIADIVQTFSVWDEQAIDHRQAKLTKLATAVWKL